MVVEVVLGWWALDGSCVFVSLVYKVGGKEVYGREVVYSSVRFKVADACFDFGHTAIK